MLRLYKIFTKPMKKLLLISTIIICGALLFNAVQAASPGSDKNVYFIHHSTGEIYRDGGMETKLEAAGYDLTAPWWDGNTDPQDFPTELADSDSWDIIGDNDILVFKSCYPASGITSKSMLNEYKDYYRELYDIYEAHPEVLFVPMSTPPLPKAMTTFKEAKRAKKFDKWLKNKYVENYSGDNLWPFRLHKQLRNKKGYLKKKYVADPYDGHPKSKSGKRVGNKLVKRLNKYFNQ